MEITIEMAGMIYDEGQVKADDFIAQIEAFIDALKQTDRIVSKKEKPTAFYRIVGLSQDSPTKVTLGVFPLDSTEDYSDELGKVFLKTLEDIDLKGEAPPDFDYEALEAYKEIGKKIDKGISRLVVSNNGYTYQIKEDFSPRIQVIQGPDEIARGSMSGRMEAINIHTPPYRFTLYPIVGPQKVRCNFPLKKKEQAISAVDKYITVFGIIKYRHRAIYPYEIDIDNIEINPPVDTLPKLADLRGIAPDLTGGLSSEEYIRKMRELDG